MAQIFPIFNPITQEHIGYKERSLVHTNGDWHRAIQANLIKKNNTGSFDILIQKRSNYVDIGAGKFDQSLATQMTDLDDLDELKTLQHGLLSELTVVTYQATRLNSESHIIKTYEEHPETLNRELLSLFIVVTNRDEQITSATPKITELFWMSWENFLKFFAKRKNEFTKTAQFYFGDPNLLQQIEELSFSILSSVSSIGTYVGYEKATAQTLLRVDKWPDVPKTYCGDISSTLLEAGELSN